MIGSAIQKNQLLQINPPTIVGMFHCSIPLLDPPMKPVGTIVVFTEILFSVSIKMQTLFLKFRAPHKGPDETCLLSQIVSRVVVVENYAQK